MFKFVETSFKMTEVKSNKKVWPQNIADELLATWQRLKRKNDPETIAKELEVSRPVIDHALIYGYVSRPELADKITKFFEDRLKRERGDAARLNQLAETSK